MTPDSIRALVPAPDTAPAVVLTEHQLMCLMQKLDDAISAANTVLDELRRLAGPSSTGEAAAAFVSMNTGTGYFRSVRDRIYHLWRQKNARLRAQETEQGAHE